MREKRELKRILKQKGKEESENGDIREGILKILKSLTQSNGKEQGSKDSTSG